jgi:hypothetical protein
MIMKVHLCDRQLALYSPLSKPRPPTNQITLTTPPRTKLDLTSNKRASRKKQQSAAKVKRLKDARAAKKEEGHQLLIFRNCECKTIFSAQ